MKLQILLLTLFTCLSLNARTVRVGDFAKYSVDTTVNEAQSIFHSTQEITEFNHEANQYNINHLIVEAETAEVIHVHDLKVSPDELNNKYYRRPGKECDDLEGELVEITVPAGEFMTCKLTFIDGPKVKVVWFGDVPFNVVKELYKEYDNGTRVITELIEFNYQTPYK